MTTTLDRFSGDAAATFDRRRAEGNAVAEMIKSFRTAVGLGWQMEANWTRPILFLVYSVAKPFAASLLLVVMLDVVGGGRSGALRGYVLVGTALWAFVQSGVGGLAMAVLDDRERYRMLKYVYVSPADFLVILLGRGAARLGIGAVGAGTTLVLGVAFLGLRFDPFAVNWPLLVFAMAIGLVAIVGVGVVMAAVCLQTREDSWSYPEALAGALFLLCAPVFPLAVLPPAAQAIGLAMPITWWIEGVRSALFAGGTSGVGGAGSIWTASTGTAQPDAVAIVVALLVTGAVGTLASAFLFRVSERRAKARGLLDQTTGS